MARIPPLLLLLGSLLPLAAPAGAATDSDADGLWDHEEAALGTDPHDEDSDDDVANDGEEVFVYSIDPLDPDTDREGLRDGDEIYVHATDPARADTDGDGLTDHEEIRVVGTFPLDADTDLDGLRDGAEIRRACDPFDADTDGDLWTDGTEVARGSNPTNPLSIPGPIGPVTLLGNPPVDEMPVTDDLTWPLFGPPLDEAYLLL